jgi:glycosyltransferase involved in cell wall biosynthesis
MDLFRPGTESRPAGELRIGFAKKLTPLSGPDVLIKAFSIVRERTNKPVSLWIAGSGLLEAELKSMVEVLKLTDRVHFAGWIESQSKLRDFFHSIDIFVQPSRRESFGVSAAQAAACGLPVISSRYGGIPEVVIDRKTGLLVAPENEQELAEAILTLVHGPGLCSSMGAEGRKWVEQNYDWRQCVAKMMKIYSECIP